jgi:hypothetical protein
MKLPKGLERVGFNKKCTFCTLNKHNFAVLQSHYAYFTGRLD